VASGGIYCLCIGIRGDLDARIGALGAIFFPEGRYIYVGSALNGLEARVRRHLRMSRGTHTAIHWHTDYLLSQPEAVVEKVYTLETAERLECAIAGTVSERGEPVKGFGCSDCGCQSHLFRVGSWDFLEGLGMREISIDDI
jgi:Uri superfamily endonuclease